MCACVQARRRAGDRISVVVQKSMSAYASPCVRVRACLLAGALAKVIDRECVSCAYAYMYSVVYVHNLPAVGAGVGAGVGASVGHCSDARSCSIVSRHVCVTSAPPSTPSHGLHIPHAGSAERPTKHAPHTSDSVVLTNSKHVTDGGRVSPLEHAVQTSWTPAFVLAYMWARVRARVRMRA